MARNDGGPAYPYVVSANDEWNEGVSLLDWFAGMALVGLISADGHTAIHEAIDPTGQRHGPRWHQCDSVAETAYDLAKAMLAARKAVQP